jgi:hypothetical protein
VQVLRDSVSDVQLRGTQAFSGALSVSSTPINSGSVVIPNTAAVKLQVNLIASQLYSSITITEKQSALQVCVCARVYLWFDPNWPVPNSVQLLSSLIGLAGIIGLFAHAFKISENLQGIRVCTSCRRSSPLHSEREDNSSCGVEGVVSPTVNPMRVLTLPGDIKVSAAQAHSKGPVTLHECSSDQSSQALSISGKPAFSTVQSRRILSLPKVPV